MEDEKYMLRCIELAQKGEGTVSPNPLVGAVIVYRNKIIGEGFHHHQGGRHAEVVAIDSVKDKSVLDQSCMYVVLEPCSHFGSTPPCANLIIKHNIPRVVISCKDPHDKVAGKGIRMLRNHGVEVLENVLSEQGKWLNRRFFTFHIKKRPYIILKWAQSKDGFLDAHREHNEKGVHWITQPNTKMITHKWRAHEDAILIGRNTATTDNPSLTVRRYFGKSPTRVVIDKSLKVPELSTVCDQKIPTLIFNGVLEKTKVNLDFVFVGENEDYLDAILKYLYQQNIQSVVIEGGAYTLNQFIQRNLWDEAKVLTGLPVFGDGLKAPVFFGKHIHSSKFQSDKIDVFVNELPGG